MPILILEPITRHMGEVGNNGLSGTLTANVEQSSRPPSFGVSNGAEQRAFLTFDLNLAPAVVDNATLICREGGVSGTLDWNDLVIVEQTVTGDQNHLHQADFDYAGHYCKTIASMPLGQLQNPIDVTQALNMAPKPIDTGIARFTLRLRLATPRLAAPSYSWAFDSRPDSTQLVLKWHSES